MPDDQPSSRWSGGRIITEPTLVVDENGKILHVLSVETEDGLLDEIVTEAK